MFWLTLVLILGAVGSCVGPQLRQFYDGQLLAQEKLEARNGHAIACKQITPGQCAQHWIIVMGTGLEVSEGPLLLRRSFR